MPPYTMEEKEQLAELVKSNLGDADPKTKSIDGVMPPELLHQHDPQLVLDVAQEMGFIITRCCSCISSESPRYKANGIWLIPDSPELRAELRNYRPASDTFCPDCEMDIYKKWGLSLPEGDC